MTVRTDFDVEVTERGPGYNPPQRMGRRLWAPMLAMAIASFAVGFILAIVRASEIGARDFLIDPDAAVSVVRLQHLVAAFMFLGFMAVFTAVSFAIARILGAFRKGGGEVQEATGSRVQTLKMPATAQIFMGFMMMGMMVLLIASILHLVAAGAVDVGNVDRAAGEWAEWLEGFRRLGVALYLFGITFGLGTIINVLRFQTIRIRELPDRA